MQTASLLYSSPLRHPSTQKFPLMFSLSLSNSVMSLPFKTPTSSPKRAETLARVSTDPATAGSTPVASSPPPIESASDVVRKFYDRINARDLAAVDELIAESCVYEDLIFSQPFVGRKAR
ncbi:hypothetical protein ACLOJK_016940 [Asimina triloba]